MKTMMMILRSGRSSRQLHTIISQETIKPSSPTPSHLHTYNLSPIDLFAMKAYLPLIFFYPKHPNCNLTFDHKSRLLKQSLSHSLTQYYPFAGRMAGPTSPSVDCNDDGVVFIEARTDTRLDTFLNLRQQDETFYQLFANDLASYSSPRNTSLVGVQLNHFACGGVGLAVSMSHVIGDGSTLGSFLSHWASLARYGSVDHKQVQAFNPVFLHSPPIDSNPGRSSQPTAPDHTNVVSRKFVFPNSKLSELKNKVVSEGVNNPSRLEVLTSLLYRTAVASSVSGGFKKSCLFMMVNVRDKFVQKLPQSTIGNVASVMMIPSPTIGLTKESSLSMVVSEIKKHKLQLDGIESVQQVAEILNSNRSKLRNQRPEAAGDVLVWCSSLCGFPINKLDFGWGNPTGTIPAIRSLHKNGFMLIDTPNGDGIEAWVVMEKQLMEVFENHKDLLPFCQTI
ncbi:hypothetical protein E3N88_05563 [Mikania micrantha]|uniref:Uncharacterized protein n=1 Tax=Mikania micrantha TaxID=192012 RepID=A0A5N6PNF9_9ASTR|nr:hypothetical protein E3N88_05563 [Mikania micrantha]